MSRSFAIRQPRNNWLIELLATNQRANVGVLNGSSLQSNQLSAPSCLHRLARLTHGRSALLIAEAHRNFRDDELAFACFC